jgi:hypothetical protein
VYFQLLGGVNVDGELQPLTPLTLETAEGEPISASVQTLGPDRVFAPDQTIPAGTRVVLKYRPTCRPAEESLGEVEYAFTTGEAYTEGLMSESSLKVTQQGQDTHRNQAFVKLRYEYGSRAGADALAHLLELAPIIDGVKAPRDEDGLSLSVTTLCSKREEEIRDGCDVLSFVPEGEHDVVAKGKVIGFGELPETRATVETDCSSKADDSADLDPAGGDDAASSDGCSLAGRPHSGTAPLLALLGLCLNRARMRRRRAG